MIKYDSNKAEADPRPNDVKEDFIKVLQEQQNLLSDYYDSLEEQMDAIDKEASDAIEVIQNEKMKND